MSRKSGNRFSEKDMRQQRDLEHSRFHLIGKCSSRRCARENGWFIHVAERLIVPSPPCGRERHWLGHKHEWVRAGGPPLTRPFVVDVRAALSRKGRGHVRPCYSQAFVKQRDRRPPHRARENPAS